MRPAARPSPPRWSHRPSCPCRRRRARARPPPSRRRPSVWSPHGLPPSGASRRCPTTTARLPATTRWRGVRPLRWPRSAGVSAWSSRQRTRPCLQASVARRSPRPRTSLPPRLPRRASRDRRLQRRRSRPSRPGSWGGTRCLLAASCSLASWTPSGHHGLLPGGLSLVPMVDIVLTLDQNHRGDAQDQQGQGQRHFPDPHSQPVS